MTLGVNERGLVDFERKSPTEEADVEEIRRGILALQAQIAQAAGRPLTRGTHAKGVAARAEFEVLDVRQTIGDPVLAGRVARGIFARAGTYPAIVRFANAASNHGPDRARDVRALSFSIEVPPGAASNGVTRLDFSMNSATTFPINDPRAFAVLVRLKSATGVGGKLRALWSLTWPDLRSVLRTVVAGVRQVRGVPRKPYQQLRYWSTVPFRHGADEAAKYSAIPDPSNPARSLESGPNCLQDEVVRHVNEDTQMSAFAFGVQLLEPARMTYRGRVQDASLWVENAAIEWKEAESPFHIVARLRLQPKSVLPPAAAETFAIDTTEHSTPETRPIGGINRARWAAEKASREARLAQPVVATPWTPPNKAARYVRIALAVATLVFAAILGWMLAPSQVLPTIDRAAPSSAVIYLDQGWTDAERRDFYHRSQGSQILPYAWFMSLPQARRGGGDPSKPFRDDAYLATAFGFIPDERDSRFNPDGLPVGYAKDVDPDGSEFIGFTCAACHTQRLTYQGKVIQIDGAPSRIETNLFGDAMIRALQGAMLPTRFPGFAAGVLGPDSSLSQRASLAMDLGGKAIQAQIFTEISAWKDLLPRPAGFGRTDALGKGGNTLFGRIINFKNPLMFRRAMSNLVPAGAHVAFPQLWDAPHFDWAQYAGNFTRPLTRNVIEALGVYSAVQFTSDDPYQTSVRLMNLKWIEGELRKLKAPPWPEPIFGTIDQAKAARGRALYNEICSGCHTVDKGEYGSQPVLKPKMFTLERIGTDSLWATDFINRKVDTAQLGGGVMGAGEALAFLSTRMLEHKYKELELTQKDIDELTCCAPNDIRGGLTINGQVVPSIRVRPLDGAWASAPFLHNGAVPNLYELLGPAEQRSATFRIGTLEYDPIKLGIVPSGSFVFDTSLPGNSNRGHEFKDGKGNGIVGRSLSDAERYDLIEFVKTIREPITR